MRLLTIIFAMTAIYNISAQLVLTDFSNGPDAWVLRTWGIYGAPQLASLNTSKDTKASLVVPLDFPNRTEAVCPKVEAKAWTESTHITFSFKAQQPLPKETIVTFFTKDNDHLWRQIRMACPPAGRDGFFTATIPIQGQPAVLAWQPCGHGRPWNSLTAGNLLEYGFIFELDTGIEKPFKGEIALVSATASSQPLPKAAKPVHDLVFKPAQPEIGQTLEVTFKLDCWPQKPYDPDATLVSGTVKTPEGAIETVNGFYFEDFLYNPDEWDKTKCLTPNGEPAFKLRYCPRTTGLHKLQIICKVDGKDFRLPEIAFQAKAPTEPFHGFVRMDKGDNQFFSYDDNTQFWGMGVNLRSPFDNRYKEVAPYSTWQDMGLAAYDMLFKKYKDAGINVVEVWMSSWWLALEWINDSPGFHGVGHYNQYRAWMLDHIMTLAKENDIYIILVINNHGKFAMHYDTEWKRNPFNKINGGYLTNCEEYYVNPQAKIDTKKLLDYIVARWGATPTLLTWKLFTELDLTGPDLNFYHDPSVAAWHAEMGAYLKKIDLYKHPVTTHWMLSYQRINDAIANLPELDFLSTDAYYNLGGGTEEMVSLLHGSRTFAKNHNKPLIITEFGGSSYADNMTNLMKQVPIGIWTGFFNEMGIVPMYWWFALIEDKNLYGNYVALSNYGANEDRRDMQLTTGDVPGVPLSSSILKNDNRILAWIFDKEYYFNSTENIKPAVRTKAVLEIQDVAPGEYTVEFWDSINGKITGTQKVTAADRKMSITLPDFQMHTAIKAFVENNGR